MMKSMLFDLKQACPFCGEPVGIFLLNQDDGLKMCSNTSCDWPFGEDSMELYNLSNVKLMDVSLDGPCSSVDLDFISTLAHSSEPVVQTNSSDAYKHTEIIDLSKDTVVLKKPENDLKLPAHEEKYLFSSVKKLQEKMQKQKCDSVITNPWMLQQLEISRQKAGLAKSDFKVESGQSTNPKYSLKITAENEGMPVQIQILPFSGDCKSNGSELPEDASVDKVS